MELDEVGMMQARSTLGDRRSSDRFMRAVPRSGLDKLGIEASTLAIETGTPASHAARNGQRAHPQRGLASPFTADKRTQQGTW